MIFNYEQMVAFYMRRLFEGFIENLDFSYDEDSSQKQRRNLGAHSPLALLIGSAPPPPPQLEFYGMAQSGGAPSLSSSDL